MGLIEEFEKSGNKLFKKRGLLPLWILLAAVLLTATPYFIEVNKLTAKLWNFRYFDVICLSISILGLFVRAYTVGYSAKNTSGRNTLSQQADSINKNGAYSILRHPLYLGNFLIYFGIALYIYNLWFVLVFFLLFWIYYERIMFAEEQFLREKFGKPYIYWSNSVNCFFPNFSKYKRSRVSFRWKKVLRQEKNGIAAIFLVYSIIHFSRTFFSNSNNYNFILFYITLFILVLYFVLKYIKHRTTWLNDKI